VDCTEAQQYAGDAIDGSLPKNIENEFQAHLDRCKPCRREVALEKLSKHMVRQSVKQIATPRSIQSFVLQSLQREYDQSLVPHHSWLARVFPMHIAVPSMVSGIVAMVFFLMVSTTTDPSFDQTAHLAPNDLIHQSFDNFALVRDGRMQATMVSTPAESVGDFFQKSNLQFGVNIPKISNCGWIGGWASECSGIKQAHLVYKVGDDWVYVFEVSDDDALYGTRVSLPLAAKRALAQSGWYTDPDHPDCNVVLWKTDEAVCVAVSTMKKGQLLALLTTR
jgi:hypothetical protein